MSVRTWIKDHRNKALAVAILGLIVAIIGVAQDRYLAGNNEATGPTTPTALTSPPPATATTDAPEPPLPSPSVTDGTDVTESPEPSPDAAEIVYLDELNDTDRNGGWKRGPVSIGATTYERSVQFTCNGKNTYFIYPVAGYATLSFYLGIDKATDAYGLEGDIAFYGDSGRKLGKSYTAVLGRARNVKVDLAGATQLKITCFGRDGQTDEQESLPHVAFGDAILTRAGTV